jgi:glucose-6-phosphate 1-epimerase
MPWRVAAAEAGPCVTLELTDTEATQAMWPHAFRVQLQIALGDNLRLALTIDNRGSEPFACEEALHTYFAVGDVHRAVVRGLEDVTFVEHAVAPAADPDPSAPIRFRAETDRVFEGVPTRIEIDAPALDRTVVLDAEDAHSAIVWNPWPAKTARLSQMAPDDWQRFVCVETGNVHTRPLRLLPGQTHTMALTLSCRE